MSTYPKFLALSAMLVFVGCGGNAATLPLVPTLGAPQGVTSLRVIGNSITWHTPSTDLGWTGSWGMAATVMERDFAHVTAASLKLPLNRYNVADMERRPADAASFIPQASSELTSSTAVVVELGDNVGLQAEDPAAFRVAYRSLLDSLSGAHSLTCTSTWWVRPAVDQVIQAECEAHKGVYVFIGDIHTDPTNADGAFGNYWHSGVQSHPHDWSMAVIAQRVSAAVFKQ